MLYPVHLCAQCFWVQGSSGLGSLEDRPSFRSGGRGFRCLAAWDEGGFSQTQSWSGGLGACPVFHLPFVSQVPRAATSSASTRVLLGSAACILGASPCKLLVSVFSAALNSDIYSAFRLTSALLSSCLPLSLSWRQGFRKKGAYSALRVSSVWRRGAIASRFLFCNYLPPFSLSHTSSGHEWLHRYICHNSSCFTCLEQARWGVLPGRCRGQQKW